MILSIDIFLGVLLLSLALTLLLFGGLTVYFGSGKPRLFGTALFVTGLVIGVAYAFYAMQANIYLIDDIITPALFYIISVIIGAVIGFLVFLAGLIKL